MTACMQQKIVGWYAELVGYFHLILPQKLIKNRQYIEVPLKPLAQRPFIKWNWIHNLPKVQSNFVERLIK